MDRPSSATATAPIEMALLERLDAAVIACDGQGRLLYANPAARSLWGGGEPVPGEDAVRRFPLLNSCGHPVTRDAHPLRRVLDGAPLGTHGCQVPSGTGERHAVHVSGRPLPDGRGAILEASAQRESDSEARLRTQVSDFEILNEVSHLLADVQDAEGAGSIVCTVATGCTGAVAVLLWELEDDELVIRGQEGVLSGDDLLVLSELARDGAELAAAEGGRRVEHKAPGEEPASAQLAVALGSTWHEPLKTRGQTSGVLSIVWPGVLEDTARPAWLIEALAHHAATALERAYLVRRLNAAARTDPLTGLANRRVWGERLSLELARAQREESPLSLILIDIDRFKSYNDRFGHPQGDALLRDSARAWGHQLRTTDLLARVGGEEFAVLLPGCPLEDACRVAERLRAAMPHGESCSLGVTTWDRMASSERLYATADAALYRAKEGGRNRYVVGSLSETEGLTVGS